MCEYKGNKNEKERKGGGVGSIRTPSAHLTTVALAKSYLM